MGLKPYRKKRDFKKTSEPEGKSQSSESGRLFVIQKHAASRLHYDFRIEIDGVLKSWAVPKGPSLSPEDKRLAIHVEDHPIEYGAFEGIIPEEEYGGGTVMVWDRGDWEPVGNPAEGLRRGKLEFKLHGEKLKGDWALIRLRRSEKDESTDDWLLIKEDDRAARNKKQAEQFLEENDQSVLTGRSMDEITEDRDKVWTEGQAWNAKIAKEGGLREAVQVDPKPGDAPFFDPATVPRARERKQPPQLKPMLATLVRKAPAGEGWLHEIKYDGYRLIAVRDGRKVRLLTRNGNDWTSTFKEIAEAMRRMPVNQAIVDGEIVILNPDGSTNFQALQNSLKGKRELPLVYYLFDLPHCEGYDLTDSPLIERKALLRHLLDAIPDKPESLRYSDHIQGGGPDVFQHACRFALEGLVSKRADSGYQPRRSKSWVKLKCMKRQEFVIGGYTDPSGSRTGFGALLLGYYQNGDLIFCGRVGTGFNETTLKRLIGRLESLQRKTPPFKNPPTGREARHCHWVTPELLAEVEYSAWTREGVLRHPAFHGLREDKDPKEVTREKPEPVEALEAEDKTRGEGGKKEKKSPARRGKKAAGKVQIAGVTLSNPDRVFYPDIGLTKQGLAEFYESIAQWALPHLTGRPLSLVRCPEGHGKECFFQKHVKESLPDTIRGLPIREREGRQLYIGIDDLPGLISLVQLGTLEVHPWLCRADNIERPDRMIFDLDPGPGAEWAAVVTAANLVRRRLGDLGLKSFVKSSGGKGLHVVVPLTRRSGWETVKTFARAIAQEVAREDPRHFIDTMSKTKRRGRVYIDYLRNSRGATCVAVYSTRARPGAPVSTPLRWDELTSHRESTLYTVQTLPRRLAALDEDPWSEMDSLRQSITQPMLKQLGLQS